jgi:molecular chaperone DnaJ
MLIGEPDAVLGTRLEVPTLEGHATVTVPPGTQPDSVLRLPHKCRPVFGSKERGDMYLRVRVHIPERLSAEERTLYEPLRTLNEKKT